MSTISARLLQCARQATFTMRRRLTSSSAAIAATATPVAMPASMAMPMRSGGAAGARILQGYSGEHRPCGLLARKVGMMSLWDVEGVRHPVTVLCVDRCHVTSVAAPHPDDRRRRWRLQVGAGPKRPFKTPKPLRYHCAKAGVEPKQSLVEFLVHEYFKLPMGFELRANHFAAGEYVDVTGTSIGKGTQGVMKRWGFKGGPASHGCSKAHRKGGSTGMSTKPGRIFKGKKMAGKMGNDRVTVRRLLVFRVDAPRNLIYVRGCVPGNAGNWVRVRDSVMTLLHGREAPPATKVSTEAVMEVKKRGKAGKSGKPSNPGLVAAL